MLQSYKSQRRAETAIGAGIGLFFILAVVFNIALIFAIFMLIADFFDFGIAITDKI